MTPDETIKRIGEAAAVAAALNLAKPRRNPPAKISSIVQAAAAKAAIITGYSRDEIREAGINPETVTQVEQTLPPTAKRYFDFVVQTIQPILLGQVSLADRIDSDYFANPENIEKIHRIISAFGITPQDLATRKTMRATSARDLCAMFARIQGVPQHSFFRHFNISEKYLRISPEHKIKKVYGEDLHKLIQSSFQNGQLPEQHRLQIIAQAMICKKAENRKNGPKVALRFIS